MCQLNAEVTTAVTKWSIHSLQQDTTHWTTKKRDILFLTITLANLNRFLSF